ncbi:MAG: peptidoglycan-binding protein [Oscillospiraceae bacterium]|nr:peptidoglycan-binding protein [Oscillospiraceae bacterium]
MLGFTHNSRKDDNITELKSMLKKLGYFIPNLSGHFDERTRRAVKAFQNDNGLNTTGKADETTREMLKQKLNIKPETGIPPTFDESQKTTNPAPAPCEEPIEESTYKPPLPPCVPDDGSAALPLAEQNRLPEPPPLPAMSAMSPPFACVPDNESAALPLAEQNRLPEPPPLPAISAISPPFACVPDNESAALPLVEQVGLPEFPPLSTMPAMPVIPKELFSKSVPCFNYDNNLNNNSYDPENKKIRPGDRNIFEYPDDFIRKN